MHIFSTTHRNFRGRVLATKLIKILDVIHWYPFHNCKGIDDMEDGMHRWRPNTIMQIAT